MNLKRYLGKIQNKIMEVKPKQEPKVVEEVEPKVVEEVDVNVKKTPNFVDSKKDPYEYLRRYLKEPKYKDWFNRNYPNYTIYDAVGLSISDYLSVKRELFPESEIINEEESSMGGKSVDTNFKPTITPETKTNFDWCTKI